MGREALDSIEYESTYLELRPARARLSGTTDAPILARGPAAVQVHRAVASYGIATADADIASSSPRTTPALPPDLSHRTVCHAPAHAVHHPAGPPASLLRLSTDRRCSGVPSGHLISPRRPRSWTLLQISLAVLSASLGIVAAVDLRAARGLFVAVAGVLILGWARLAWRGTRRAEPFGVAITRVLDRLVTALGTFFAIALWAKYAPHAPAAFSRTVVLVLCGIGLIGRLLAVSRNLHP